MDAALAAIRGGIDDLGAVDVAVLDADVLGRGVLSIQTLIDRLRVVQARWIAEFDQRRGWAASGHRDMATWLAAKGKTSVGNAKKATALGEAMSSSPELADAVTSGEITPDTAEALGPTLSSNHSGDIAELIADCKGATPAEARAAGSEFQNAHPPTGQTAADREAELREKRYLRFRDRGDGLKDIDGCLPALDARTVEEALRSIAGKTGIGDGRTYEQKLADALVQLCDAYNRGEVRGGRSNLPTILITIDINDLNGTSNGSGYTSRGDVIPAEAVRQMTTNANLQRVILDDSMPLDIGRLSRLATLDQWRALVARDGGCRMDGCTIPPEWCQADHIHEWDAQHGPTDIDLLVLWCVYHHHYRHRPDVQLIGDANNLAIQHPDGRIVPLPPRGPTHQHKKPPTNNTGTNSGTGTGTGTAESGTAESGSGRADAGDTNAGGTDEQGTLFGDDAAA